MKNIFTMFFMLTMLATTFAQSITVRDEADYLPIEGVMVSDENNNMAFTNSQGKVNIKKFSNSQQITISLLGYVSLNISYDDLSKMKADILLKQDELSLDEVVISANRWQQNKSEVPNRITAVTKKDIVLQNPQTSADLLGFSDEVYIQKSQLGGGSPMIRGFSTNRLLLTIDGVRMNTAIFRGGNLQNVISIDPLAVESSEIIFGPGSVIYGSDAIGGVMSFYTLEPALSTTDKVEVSGSALTRYSSANGERTGHFDVNIGGKKWASTTSFSYSEFGDLRMGSNGPDDYLVPVFVSTIDSQDVVVNNPDPEVQTPTGYNQVNMMQKIRFSPNENWDLTYGLHYSTTSNYARFDRHRRMRDGYPRYAEWYYGPQEWMMNNLKISHSKANAIYDNVTLNMAYQNFEESRHSRNFGSTTLENNVETVDAYSVNLDFEKGDEKPHRFFYGLEAILNKVGSTGEENDIYTGVTAPIAPRYPEGSTWSSYAAYLSYEYVPSEVWAWQAGVRYNAFAIQASFDDPAYAYPFEDANLNNGALTGSLGTVYSPGPTWKIRANLSTGFRAPNIDDVGKLFESVDYAVVVPNPDLKAEYAYNAEVGIAKVFSNVVKLDATAYYTILENAQVRRPYSLNGQDSVMYNGEMSQVLAIQNAANARVYGVQVGMEIKLPAGFALESVYNWQKGEEELDDGETAPMRHAAPAFGSTHLRFMQNRVMLDLYANYNAEMSYDDLAPSEQEKGEIYAADANGNPYSPSWYTLNFKGSYQINSHFQVTAGLENITDQRYLPYSSGIVAAGRNFIMGLRANF
ncbi:TonB-dependent receptor [Owenweeksia hongkongensis]|uniref:TonB-dependent receptor n=1 Tax=Owenweeksia hongkongensis TaxID=253245 RepID=UPI003A953E8F